MYNKSSFIYISIVFLTFIIIVVWEFFIEGIFDISIIHDGVESNEEHWEYVFTTTIFVAVASIFPLSLLTKQEAGRREAEKVLQKSKTTLDEAQKIGQMGSWEYDLTVKKTLWSDNLYRLYGYDSDVEPTFEKYLSTVHPDDQNKITSFFDIDYEGPGLYEQEYRIIRQDGEVRTVLNRFNIEINEKGDPSMIRGINQDITERKKAGEALRESEERYRKYITNSPDGVFVIDSSGKYIEVNEAACKETGYTEGEFLTMSISDLISPEYLENGMDSFGKLITTGAVSDELLLYRKDGTKFYIQLDAIKLDDNRYIGFAKDITERKQGEISKEQFSRRLVESMEKDRKRIASEVHDGLGQKVLLIRSGIQKCLKLLSEKEKATEILNQISTLTQESMNEIRIIISNLHPHQLDQLGLKGAIDSTINHASLSFDIIFHSSIQDIDGLLPKKNEIHLYRIIQEGLNNIVVHSTATKSDITISKTKNSLNINIKDNGKGFVVDSGRNDHRGFGLAGISERVSMLGGSLEVDSLVGRGTTLSIEIPHKKEEGY